MFSNCSKLSAFLVRTVSAVFLAVLITVVFIGEASAKGFKFSVFESLFSLCICFVLITCLFLFWKKYQSRAVQFGFAFFYSFSSCSYV